jgi:hypothetical protein
MVIKLGKKEKIELLIIIIGIGGIISIAAGKMFQVRSNNNHKTKLSESNNASIFGLKTNVIKYQEAKWGIDPFYPAETSSASYGTGGLILTGIMWDKDNPLAIINDNVVKIGDKLNEFTVSEINEKNVVLEKDGNECRIELRE